MCQTYPRHQSRLPTGLLAPQCTRSSGDLELTALEHEAFARDAHLRRGAEPTRTRSTWYACAGRNREPAGLCAPRKIVPLRWPPPGVVCLESTELVTTLLH